MIDFPKDYCFIIGEQFDCTKYNINIIDQLKSEITIACNYTIKIFQPTIYIAGSHTIIRYLIDNHKFINDTIYILSPTALISNCFNIDNMQPWLKDPSVIRASAQNSYTSVDILEKFKKIINDNQNIFLIKDIKKLTLTRDLDTIIDKELIKKNFRYCYKYNNIIPMIILKYAKKYNVNMIFLLGCNLNKYQGKNREDIYNGIKLRAFKSKMIDFINASIEENETLDFLPNYDLGTFYKYYVYRNISISNIIKEYVNYCKIDILKNKNKDDQLNIIINELDMLSKGKESLDYESYETIYKFGCFQ